MYTEMNTEMNTETNRMDQYYQGTAPASSGRTSDRLAMGILAGAAIGSIVAWYMRGRQAKKAQAKFATELAEKLQVLTAVAQDPEEKARCTEAADKLFELAKSLDS